MPDLEQRIARMEKMISFLVREKNKEQKGEEWIPEKEAAELLNWVPRTLRGKAKAGIVPIQFRSRQGRNFFYRKDQVLKFRIDPVFIQN